MRGATLVQRVQKGRSAGVGAPTIVWRPRRRGCHRDGGLGFGAGMPWWHGQPQHVAHGACAPVGHRPRQRSDLGAEGRFSGDHPIDPAQPARVVGSLDPLQQPSVHQAPRETHPKAHPTSRSVVQLSGH